MREHKYRVWNRRISKMKYGVGVYEDLLIYYMDYDEQDLHIQGNVEIFRLPDKDFELMEFTGRQDSKGTYVYEDDVVRCQFQVSKLVKSTPPSGTSYADYVRRTGDAAHIETNSELGVAAVEMIDGCWVANYISEMDGKTHNLLLQDDREVVGTLWEHPHLRELVKE